MKKKDGYFNENYSWITGILAFLICYHTAACQQLLPDSTLLQLSIVKARNLYGAEMKNNQRLYNGYQYIYPAERTFNSPFWIGDSLVPGNIGYDGNDYPGIRLKYDLVRQNIIINNSAYEADIVLPPEKITHFSIYQHDFFMLHAGDSNYHAISTGFYDRLYKGAIAIWAQRSKQLERSLKAEERLNTFKETTVWYIQVDRLFYPVNNKRDIIKVLKEKEKAVNNFIKVNKLDFKKNFEQALILAVRFYDNN